MVTLNTSKLEGKSNPMKVFKRLEKKKWQETLPSVTREGQQRHNTTRQIEEEQSKKQSSRTSALSVMHWRSACSF